jgi:hypothetical protein
MSRVQIERRLSAVERHGRPTGIQQSEDFRLCAAVCLVGRLPLTRQRRF